MSSHELSVTYVLLLEPWRIKWIEV